MLMFLVLMESLVQKFVRAAGHVISQYGSTYAQTYNNYQFTVSSGTATNGTTQGGGGSVAIGPVTFKA